MVIVKVLLITTIETLGHVGEVVDVSDGYARNYLLPKRFALPPTAHNIERYAKAKSSHAADIEVRAEKAQRLHKVLADRTLVFIRKAHDNDRLYGSVRAEHIVAQIEEELHEHIEASRVQMKSPIETLGPHAVTINLYKDISVEMRVRVDEEVDSDKADSEKASLDETRLDEARLEETRLEEARLEEAHFGED